jgi:hypothetical protein
MGLLIFVHIKSDLVTFEFPNRIKDEKTKRLQLAQFLLEQIVIMELLSG